MKFESELSVWWLVIIIITIRSSLISTDWIFRVPFLDQMEDLLATHLSKIDFVSLSPGYAMYVI